MIPKVVRRFVEIEASRNNSASNQQGSSVKANRIYIPGKVHLPRLTRDSLLRLVTSWSAKVRSIPPYALTLFHTIDDRINKSTVNRGDAAIPRSRSAGIGISRKKGVPTVACKRKERKNEVEGKKKGSATLGGPGVPAE